MYQGKKKGIKNDLCKRYFAIDIFSKIKKLDVIRQIFYQINIPNEVANEIQGKKDTAAAEILKANWIVTREVKNVSLVNALTKVQTIKSINCRPTYVKIVFEKVG